MIGSANAEYVPLSVSLDYTGNGDFKQTGGGLIGNVTTGTTIYIQFVLNEATNRGGKKLYIDAVKLVLYDADDNDYLEEIVVQGVRSDGTTSVRATFNNSDSFYKAAQIGVIEENFTAEDFSTYLFATVRYKVVSATVEQIDLTPPLLNCYYA